MCVCARVSLYTFVSYYAKYCIVYYRNSTYIMVSLLLIAGGYSINFAAAFFFLVFRWVRFESSLALVFLNSIFHALVSCSCYDDGLCWILFRTACCKLKYIRLFCLCCCCCCCIFIQFTGRIEHNDQQITAVSHLYTIISFSSSNQTKSWLAVYAFYLKKIAIDIRNNGTPCPYIFCFLCMKSSIFM